jgi:PTS system nitrogen regulatory IIA component
MKIIDFVSPELIIPELSASEKSDVIRELADHLSGHLPGVDRDSLAKVLLDRERLASTAIGEGVAIPHGKLDAVTRLVACVGRASKGVNFDSMDGRPTQIFFVLVAPEQATGVHLKALARISRLFRAPDFRSRLLQASDAESMYQLIVDEDARH